MADKDAASVRVSFVKDTVYGALTVIVFAAMGWDQAYAACAHGLSAVCLFAIIAAEESEATLTWLFLASSICTVLADAATILMTTCSLKSCCKPGSTSPSFFPWVDAPNLCTGSSRRVDTQVIAITAEVTVGVGILVGLQRIRLCSRGSKGHGWWTPFVAYALLRSFVLAWVYEYYIVLALGLISLLSSLGALGWAFVLRRKAREGEDTRRGELGLLGIALFIITMDLTGLALVASEVDGAEEAIAPYCTCQVVAVAIQVWVLATSRSAVRGSKKEKGNDDGTGDSSENKIRRYRPLSSALFI
jgi:hypothetical protein